MGVITEREWKKVVDYLRYEGWTFSQISDVLDALEAAEVEILGEIPPVEEDEPNDPQQLEIVRTNTHGPNDPKLRVLTPRKKMTVSKPLYTSQNNTASQSGENRALVSGPQCGGVSLWEAHLRTRNP